MPKVVLKSRLLASTARHEDPNPGNYLVDGNLEGNASGPSEPKQSVVADNFPSREAASYLIGLDDKPGAALLAASVRDVLIRIDNVCGITGLSVPTIYRLMSKGTFPRPVKITTSARAWKLSEVTAWVDSRERGGAGL
jgi:prophage regulatory protein